MAQEEAGQELFDLTPLIKSKLAWDILPHKDIHEWLNRLDLIPPGEELLEMEHQATHERAEAALLIAPLAEVYAALIAEIQSVYYGDKAEATEEQREHFEDNMFQLGRTAVLATLVELLDSGYLAYGPKALMFISGDE